MPRFAGWPEGADTDSLVSSTASLALLYVRYGMTVYNVLMYSASCLRWHQGFFCWNIGSSELKFTLHIIMYCTQIMVCTLNGCSLTSDPSHPCYSLIRLTLKAFCFALDPDDLPPSLPSHLHQMIQLHTDHHRDSVKSLLDPPMLPPKETSTSTLAREELSECTLVEHAIAAGVISSDMEGLQALKTVHSALRKKWTGCSGCGFSLEGFDPIKEYKNVATLGTEKQILLTQQNLMLAAEHIDMKGTF